MTDRSDPYRVPPRLVFIAGNGDLLPEAEDVAARADLVIRFNNCRSAGAAADRTDVVAVCSTGRPGKAMALSPEWQESDAVKAAKQIWCVRDPVYFARLRHRLAITHPELDDFCEEYSEAFRAFTDRTGKVLRIIPRRDHHRTVRMLAAFDPAPYVVPSSGLIAIVHVMEAVAGPQTRIVLDGFGHVGWEWHPFEAERRLVEDLARKGALARLSSQNASALLQGA